MSIDIEKLRALCNAATPWPWRVRDRKVPATARCEAFIDSSVDDANGFNVASCGPAPHDAAFIAAAREAVPALIAEVDRLTDAKLYGEKVCAALVAERDAARGEIERLRNPSVMCSCTHEAGDSDCAKHPRCNNCGESQEGTKLAWLAAHAKAMARAADNEKAEAKEMRKQRDTALARIADLERERDVAQVALDEWKRGAQMVVDMFDPMKARAAYPTFAAIVSDAAKKAHEQVRSERNTLRAQLEAVGKERDEVRADATLALALDQEQIDSLTATVQRESAWVNERDDVLAHIAGVLHEIARCTTIENARTFAEQARANMAERHAGLWAPGPHDDPADWKPGHWRGAK